MGLINVNGYEFDFNPYDMNNSKKLEDSNTMIMDSFKSGINGSNTTKELEKFKKTISKAFDDTIEKGAGKEILKGESDVVKILQAWVFFVARTKGEANKTMKEFESYVSEISGGADGGTIQSPIRTTLI